MNRACIFFDLYAKKLVWIGGLFVNKKQDKETNGKNFDTGLPLVRGRE
jgi:hypothetical protein